MKSIRVFAPATVANVACGFDILGFAVEAPGDEVSVSLTEKPGVEILQITGDDGRLPRDPMKNTASASVIQFLQSINSKVGIEIKLHKHMPLGSGLGSSAASSVASVFAVNELLGRPLSKKELLPFTMFGEKIACGTMHADNVAPALFGGFVLIRSYDPLDIVQIPTPEKLFVALIHPHIEIRTEDARKILKKEILLSDAVKQWGNTAGLIAGLMSNDYSLISRSLKDVIIEPTRSLLIPGFASVQKAALKAGALGCSISGSGPSMFALTTSRSDAKKIGEAMKSEYLSLDIESTIYTSKISGGPKIID